METGTNMRTTPLLTGEKVHLNAMTKEDANTVQDWLADSQFARLYDALPAMPPTRDTVVSDIEDANNDKNTYSFAVRLRNAATLIGKIELDGIIWVHRYSYISIAIAPQYQAQGYGTEAMLLAIDFAFNELNLHRLFLSVFSYNQPAIALYEKLGFVREGEYREHIRRDGEWHSMCFYGLLHHEWESVGNPIKNDSK